MRIRDWGADVCSSDLSCASGRASIVPFSSLAKSAAPSAGTADAAAPSTGMGVASEEKSSALRLVSMFTSDISCPLHPAIARQGRQLVLPPFLQVRAGAILELHGDFAIPIGRQGKAFLGLHLAARIVERTIQLTPRLFQPADRQSVVSGKSGSVS